MIRFTGGVVLLGVLVTVLAVPRLALAHRSGCHTLHTCPSDSASYVCGDLGYPCNGATSIKDIPLEAINVPLLVESVFRDTFGRKPTEGESRYWKQRFRSDKESIYQVRRAMAWHAANASFGPPKPNVVRQVGGELVPRINALFRLVYDGRNPTVTENQYWLSRISDKPSEAALVGAMRWHRIKGIQH